MEKQKTIEIRLEDENQLFIIPEINPLLGDTIYETGMETIYDQVRKYHNTDRIHLKLRLPKSRIVPGLEAKIGNAIRDYCDYQIHKINHSLELQTHQGRRTLIYGITILVICLLLSGIGFFISTNASSAVMYAIGGFMYNGFMIIGWVSLWTPTSMLVFERWPDWISRKTYQRMHRMEIEVLPSNE